MAQIENPTEVTFLPPSGPKPQMAYLFDINPEDEAVEQWEPATLPTDEGVVNLAYDNETGRLYAATESGVVFASDDQGESWIEVRTGSVEELWLKPR